MKYSFRQLEVFAEAAHFENITKAAKQLTMSQSAASGALKELEHSLISNYLIGLVKNYNSTNLVACCSLRLMPCWLKEKL